jgi:hypothetical protein
MQWMYANKYGQLPSGQAEIVEALVKIAEELEQVNKNLIAIKNSEAKVKISGGINTHPY